MYYGFLNFFFLFAWKENDKDNTPLQFEDDHKEWKDIYNENDDNDVNDSLINHVSTDDIRNFLFVSTFSNIL